MTTHDENDEIFLSMLRKNNSLNNFFDAVFGFLYRKTDFFNVNDNRSNFATDIVIEKFKKWQNEAKKCKKSLPPIESNVDLANKKRAKSEKQLKLITENGAVFEKYSWSQKFTDLEINAILPAELSVKNLSVNLKSRTLEIKNSVDNQIILSGQLSDNCKNYTMIWSVENQLLTVHVEKIKAGWWKKLFTTEAEIDLSQLDYCEPLSDLSDAAISTINDIYVNPDQEQQHLSAKQQKLLKTVKDSWNIEGSPFTGPYDPNKVQLG